MAEADAFTGQDLELSYGRQLLENIRQCPLDELLEDPLVTFVNESLGGDSVAARAEQVMLTGDVGTRVVLS